MGKGGGKSGKSGLGKALGIVGAVAGGFFPAIFGATSAFAGAIFGLSLGTTIGAAFSKQDLDTATSNFDAKMNNVSSDARIPLVYGTRMIGGLQSYHNCNVNDKRLIKDVIIGEGTFSGAYGITANGYMCQVNNASANVFAVKNTKYSDARARINDHHLELYANGSTVSIYLDKTENLKDDQSNDYQCSIAKLYEYIEGINYDNGMVDKGWLVDRPVICDDQPYNLANTNWQNCYNTDAWFWEGTYESGESRVTFYDGSQGAPSYYEKVGGYPNMAYLHGDLRYTEKIGSGNPTLTVIAQGRKVYDTRTGKWGYSENPAMIVRDYLINKTFGSGYFITEDMLDEDSFKEVANFCDQQIQRYDGQGRIVTEPRYTLNIVFNEKQSYLEHVQQMLASFAGFIVFSNGKVALRVEKAETPVYAFDDDNIVADSLSYKVNSMSDSPNRLVMKYIEPVLNWTSTNAIVEDLQDQQPSPIGRGKIISKDVELIGVTSQSQALRLGKIYRDIIRLCPVTVTFKTAMQAMHLEPGDVVTFSHNVTIEGKTQPLFTDMPVRIEEIQDDNGEFTLTCRQYNSSIYDDSLGGNLKVHSYSGSLTEEYLQESVNMNGWYNPPADVTMLRYSISDTDTSEVTLTWNGVQGNTIKGYLVYINDELQGNVITDTKYVFKAPKSGTYTFKVVTVDIYGGKSLTPPIVTVDVIVEPKAVLGFNATINPRNRAQVDFDWLPNKEVNISYYELRIGNTWETGETIVNRIKSLNATYVIGTSGYYTFMIKAVNSNGAYSVEPASVSRQITVEPPAPTGFKVIQSGQDKSKATVVWDTVVGDDIRDYEVRQGENWNSAVVTGKTKDTTLDILLPGDGTFTYLIKAITVNDHASPAASTTITCSVKPYDVSNFTAEQSLSDKSRVTLSWDAPNEVDVSHYIIKEGTSWDSATLISPRVFGTFYDVTINTEGQHTWLIKAVSIAGYESQYAAVATNVFSLRPSAVATIQAYQSEEDRSKLIIQWSPVSDGDLSGYQVKIGDTWNSAEPLPFTREVYTEYTLTKSFDFMIMIKAQNNAGYFSDETSITFNAKVEPDDVTGLVAYQNGDSIELFWDVPKEEKDITGYEVREGLSFDSSSVIESLVISTDCTIDINVPRNYTYYVRAINKSGNYSRVPANVLISVDNLLPRNVIATYDIIATESGTHDRTNFTNSDYNFQTIGGRWLDYPTTRFQDIGGSKVIKLIRRRAWDCSLNDGAYISIPDNEKQMPTKNLTVFVDLYANSREALSNSKINEPNGWAFDATDGYLRFSLNLKNNGVKYVKCPLSSLSDNWTAVFGSFDGANIKLFVNNELIDSLSISDDEIVYKDFGAKTDVAVNGFDGLLGTLMIMNRQLTGNELNDISQNDTFPADNVGLYLFGDEGYTLHDDSSVGNNGSLLRELIDTGTYYKHGVYTSDIIDIGNAAQCGVSVLFESTATMYGGRAELQSKQSLDGERWTDWSIFKPAERSLRYIQFRTIIDAKDVNLYSPEVNKFIVSIDVPDKDIAMSVKIDKGGSTILYGCQFHEMPAVVPAAIGVDLHAELVSKTLDSCLIYVKDANNNDVGGDVDIHIRGF